MTAELTARARILARPEAVQLVLRAKITKDSIDDPAPDFEKYGVAALFWWDSIMVQMRAVWRDSYEEPDPSESEVAERIIAGLRKQPVWGKILRGAAQ
jgi:hypothetical protein